MALGLRGTGKWIASEFAAALPYAGHRTDGAFSPVEWFAKQWQGGEHN